MPYIPIESYGPKGKRSWSWSVSPKGFGLKHKVCFNQLPEQIREHYRAKMFWTTWSGTCLVIGARSAKRIDRRTNCQRRMAGGFCQPTH